MGVGGPFALSQGDRQGDDPEIKQGKRQKPPIPNRRGVNKIISEIPPPVKAHRVPKNPPVSPQKPPRGEKTGSLSAERDPGLYFTAFSSERDSGLPLLHLGQVVLGVAAVIEVVAVLGHILQMGPGQVYKHCRMEELCDGASE